MRWPAISTAEAFWRLVDRTGDGCWPWKGYVNRTLGYGVVTWKGVKGVYAHRLAYELEVGAIPVRLLVCHHCDNPPCVRPSHLYAGTKSDNGKDAWARGQQTVCYLRRKVGSEVNSAKLTESAVREIRRSYGDGEFDQESLARLYGVSGTEISLIINRKRWGHLDAGEPIARPPRVFAGPRGSERQQSKLSESAVRQILRRIAGGDTQASIARDYGVASSLISDIVTGKRWKHVDRSAR